MGQVWSKEAPAASVPAAPSEVLTNEDIIRMVEAKLGDSVILAKIQGSTVEFNTSIDGLIVLKQAGVSDAVIQAMTEAGSR